MKKFLLLIFILFYSVAFSQFVVKGKVSDKLTKEELIGANIVWKQQNLGVSTNLNGQFEIIIPPNNFPIKLTVSYMGYSTQKITIKKDEWKKNKGIYNIYLKSDNKLIKEVKIVDSRLTKKQKESPLTVESLDIFMMD